MSSSSLGSLGFSQGQAETLAIFGKQFVCNWIRVSVSFIQFVIILIKGQNFETKISSSARIRKPGTLPELFWFLFFHKFYLILFDSAIRLQIIGFCFWCYQVLVWKNMYTSRGNNAYGQQSYAGQSAYGQNVSLYNSNSHRNFIGIRIGLVSVFWFSDSLGVVYCDVYSWDRVILQIQSEGLMGMCSFPWLRGIQQC